MGNGKKYYLAGIMLALPFIMGFTGKSEQISERDAVYEQKDAYVCDTQYTYAVAAEEQGDYTIQISGEKLQNTAIQVNGLEVDAQSGQVHLNKGINSITFVDGTGINTLVVKAVGTQKEYGATALYTSYEAEHGVTNTKIEPDTREYRVFGSEASGRQYVKLEQEGDYLEIELTADTNAFVLRYCIPDSSDGNGSDETLNYYLNGELHQANLTSHYSWVYGLFPWSNNPEDRDKGDAHYFFDDVRIKLDQTYSKGTVLRFEKGNNNDAQYYLLDVIETELLDEPIPINSNALSIEAYGAVANDGQDDAKAITACIKDAAENGKEVYFPEGVFEIGNPVFIKGIKIGDDGLVIRGAGMWYTTIQGEAAGFNVSAADVSFYDFSLMGNVTQRKDSIDPPAFDMVASIVGRKNIKLQNIWIEHYKVGLWADVTNGIHVLGCRIRNTLADGINLCGGTSNCVITQNDIRNTGDDAIAMFNRGVLEENNKVSYNTVGLPWLANNIALYGGKDIEITHNWLKDTIAFGGGVNISTNFNPQVFEGTIMVRDNLLERCGSKNNDDGFDIGAIWMNTVEGYDNTAECIIKENRIKDSSYQGIHFYNSGLLENMKIEGNEIENCGTVGIQADKNVVGSVTIKNNKITGVTEEIDNKAQEKFEIYD